MRVFLLLALLPAAVRAETLADTHLRLNFCYQQSFDGAYLREHPEQQVRRIALGREPAGTTERLGEVSMELGVTLRDGSGELEALARCRPEGDGLACDLGRDAGGFGLEAQGEDLLLTVAPEGMVLEGWRSETRLEPGEGGEMAFLVRRCG